MKLDGGLERVLGGLKRAMALDGALKALTSRRHFEKPSVKAKQRRVEA